MGRGKSRHYRNESDPLLGFYSQTLAATSSVRNASNPLYATDVQHTTTTTAPLSPLKSSLRLLRQPFSGNNDEPELDTNYNNKAKYRVHRVSYTAQNHVQVLFQMYGSAFPQVLPFCVLNVIWTYLVYHLKNISLIDLTFHSSVGHSFMGLLVSFLIVSRSKISYDRFMDFRKHLATSYRACREIAQFTSVYTFATQTPQAKAWRQEVCYQTILLLRVAMDALLWSSTEREKWEDEYFRKYEIRMDPFAKNNEPNTPPETPLDKTLEPRRLLYGSEDKEQDMHSPSFDSTHDDDVGEEAEKEDAEANNRHTVSEHFFQFRRLTHGRRSMIDENFRAPITFCHVLRQTIMEHPTALGYKMPVNEYRDLLNFVTIFNESFHSFRVLIFTPYPFPLVQMTRAFLFFWVYTLPMVLLKEYRLWSSVLIVLLVSFGFVGIEYVSMALDDPFGDDTNDVDEHGMALLVYEDIYMALYRTDGPRAAFELRERVLARYKQGRGLDCYRDDLKGYGIWEPAHLQQQKEKDKQQRQQQQRQPPQTKDDHCLRPPRPPYEPPAPSNHGGRSRRSADRKSTKGDSYKAIHGN